MDIIVISYIDKEAEAWRGSGDLLMAIQLVSNEERAQTGSSEIK